MSEQAHNRSASLAEAAPRPAVALEDVWLRFNLRLYKKRLTLRGPP